MGKLSCKCGHLISDSVTPCAWSGELKWETEVESQSNRTPDEVEEFLNALEEDDGVKWIQNYFGQRYPKNLPRATVIDDIYSNNASKEGRAVLQCTKCERLYVQKQFYSDKWTCFEKTE